MLIKFNLICGKHYAQNYSTNDEKSQVSRSDFEVRKSNGNKLFFYNNIVVEDPTDSQMMSANMLSVGFVNTILECAWCG